MLNSSGMYKRVEQAGLVFRLPELAVPSRCRMSGRGLAIRLREATHGHSHAKVRECGSARFGGRLPTNRTRLVATNH